MIVTFLKFITSVGAAIVIIRPGRPPPNQKILPTPLHAWTLSILEYVTMSICK